LLWGFEIVASKTRTTAMEGAFTHLGNHLISDSASAINAGDDFSTIDADEAALDREYQKTNLNQPAQAPPRRRRARDNDDDDTDVFPDDDDDADSLASHQVNGQNGPHHQHQHEEEHDIELPTHACAYVASLHSSA
jgi:regulator of nonsense transcripts 1